MESDIQARCVGSINCNARTLLQGLAVLLSHPVLTWTLLYSLLSSLSPTVRPCRCSAGFSPLLYRAPYSVISRTSSFHSRYTLNRCPSATAPLCRATYPRSAFLPTSASYPARWDCCSLPCPLPGLWPRGSSSPERYPQCFTVVSVELTALWTPAHISTCDRYFALMLTLRSFWFITQQQVMFAHLLKSRLAFRGGCRTVRRCLRRMPYKRR